MKILFDKDNEIKKKIIAKAVFDDIEKEYEEVFDDADGNFLAISKLKIERKKKKWLE